MTEAEIWFNYRHAMAQASALDQIAAQLKSGVQAELERGMHETAAGWQGDNAKRWQGKGQALQERIGTSARRLQAAAGEVREAARRAREIELANLAVIENQST